ncbi:hypothetical protein ACSQ67_000857 [Phaseolus vulgaris]
MINFI